MEALTFRRTETYTFIIIPVLSWLQTSPKFDIHAYERYKKNTEIEVINIDVFVLIAFFNPIITLMLGFIIGNLMQTKPYKWVAGIIVTVLFFLFIVMINHLSFDTWQTWLYFAIYLITMMAGIQLSAFIRKFY
ncbi:sterol desaturase/sphingolipid hydroxylase (fatty acid hydroxylase superfamily) [Geomicrobium halophilum]|uniref:Sterol desaturase/sphingolipid hydroxylase (Fatty acid hydroxylase superfamily) n=1 Tax=Geomicrobium halophilum TaxID=549000 RepID=A0A841PHA5_9BACL|nr:hypothetical protein [Geomicrobium halophilum]MBB6448129.1 sterol desaturase/sphingolipid hydroxylase (fatty acid hydroxylase superfamily) [Geomicrobium halophilum]